MAKIFKDFTYLDRKLSELDGHYVSVDFEQNPDSAFAFSRDISYGDTNHYRTEPNVSWSHLGDRLTFELHIVKDPDYYSSQADAILTNGDIRELTRWLTSTITSQYLILEYEEQAPYDTPCYYGQFSDIRPFNINGDVYGLRLIFECSSPYGYTEELVDTMILKGNTHEYILNSQDDRLEDYCYPSIRIESNVTGQIFLCNLSDCQIYQQGTLDLDSTSDDARTLLQNLISDYGLTHGYAPEYTYEGNGSILTVCDGTAIPFSYTDSSDNRFKCMAFYSTSNGSYAIIQGGFLYLTVKKSLPVRINAEKLFLFDDLDRMIRLSELGIEDVDYMYWPRLRSGDNRLLLWGTDCTITITHRETRKAGA
ncbi:phage tail domain-containing protein [Bariatricus sp. SGI.154]|uniref:phage tail domain-containing protein n=1 Tax=Bariatricus sp. SGI.154 TaxID=3420549 RepID=UPI003CFFC312